MAKFGELDPRWIVEVRPDATNVNNWHWTEKNASSWSKDKLKGALEGLTFTGDEGHCKITELSKCDGEATVNNRKAKLIFFYEWDIVLDWEGQQKDSTEKIKGQITIPNLSDENSADDLDIQVSCKSSSAEGSALKEMMRRLAVSKVRSELALYIKELREEYGQNLILPTATNTNRSGQSGVSPSQCKTSGAQSAAVSSKGSPSSQESMTSASTSAASASTNGLPSVVSTSTLTENEEFQASPDDLYQVFVDPQRVQAFTRGACTVNPSPGGEFVLLDGNITGHFVDLVPGKKIVQKWRRSAWPAGHFSEVTMEFVSHEYCTVLKLQQTAVPSNDLAATQQGWRDYFWNSIKLTFGYGSKLLV